MGVAGQVFLEWCVVVSAVTLSKPHSVRMTQTLGISYECAIIPVCTQALAVLSA